MKQVIFITYYYSLFPLNPTKCPTLSVANALTYIYAFCFLVYFVLFYYDEQPNNPSHQVLLKNMSNQESSSISAHSCYLARGQRIRVHTLRYAGMTIKSIADVLGLSWAEVLCICGQRDEKIAH